MAILEAKSENHNELTSQNEEAIVPDITINDIQSDQPTPSSDPDNKTSLDPLKYTIGQLKPVEAAPKTAYAYIGPNKSFKIAVPQDKLEAITSKLIWVENIKAGPFGKPRPKGHSSNQTRRSQNNHSSRNLILTNNDNNLYMNPVTLPSIGVAWFTLDSEHPDLTVSTSGASISCDSYEHRVTLGSVGFSRGSHYWEYYIDKYDGNADIAFGIARIDVNKEMILGKSNGSWSMYIDGERSWLMHSGQHFNRTSGGVHTGDTVGLMLNLQDKSLTFYVNKKQQGCVSLHGIHGVLYPAGSLNRSVQLTVRTGLNVP
ncbi:unnamed protein product, partial [Meganyctiphanes norvegica]